MGDGRFLCESQGAIATAYLPVGFDPNQDTILISEMDSTTPTPPPREKFGIRPQIRTKYKGYVPHFGLVVIWGVAHLT